MASELGRLIRQERKQAGYGLREFAKTIDKSPAFLTQLECDDQAPAVAEETLRTIAAKLKLDSDLLLVLAKRTPSDVVPESALDVALYRKVKAMSDKDKKKMLGKL